MSRTISALTTSVPRRAFRTFESATPMRRWSVSPIPLHGRHRPDLADLRNAQPEVRFDALEQCGDRHLAFGAIALDPQHRHTGRRLEGHEVDARFPDAEHRAEAGDRLP